jgi:hypothetical protein
MLTVIHPEWKRDPYMERIAQLTKALEESVRLQSHYAALLNQYDGGDRQGFGSADAWIERLRELDQL